MKTRAELKAMAKEQIRGNIGALFVITLIIGGISFLAGLILGMIPMGSLIVSLIITPAFSLSTLRIYLALVNSGQKPEPRDAFSGFDDFWSAFKTTFPTGLFTFLWSLLFIIPGIIKGYSYSMAMYIVAENPGISALEAIDRSKKMMDGHKMEFFILYLSFYVWALLTVITFGIAGIWTIPYMNATLANFYNEVKPKETFYTNDAPAFDQF